MLGWAVTQSGSETELDLERQRSWKVPLGSTLGPCEERAGLSSEDLPLPVLSSPSSSPSPPLPPQTCLETLLLEATGFPQTP